MHGLIRSAGKSKESYNALFDADNIIVIIIIIIINIIVAVVVFIIIRVYLANSIDFLVSVFCP